MRWHVDVEAGKYSGWVLDPHGPDRVFEILVLAGDRVWARGRADRGSSGHDFCLEAAVTAENPRLICLGAHPELPALILHSPLQEEVGAALAQQDSPGMRKLEALRLPPLFGKSLLHLGCGEGHLCLRAHLAGAGRVLGLDLSEAALSAARERTASGFGMKSLEFRQGGWGDVPEERFDLIVPALPDGQEQNTLQSLLTRLAPDGLLALECDVAQSAQQGWARLRHAEDTRRFPTESYLLDKMLAGYAVRKLYAGKAQAGDPVLRALYHCTPRRPVVALIRGASGAGKSVLARLLGRKGVPVFRADVFLREYGGRWQKYAPDTALYHMLRDELGNFTLNRAADRIKALGATREFCRDFVRCLPLEEDLCVVEGALFEDEELFAELTRLLEKKGAVVWDMRRVLTT